MRYQTNAPACYQNFIGTRTCSDIPSVSGYYIEDLEGLSLNRAANIADAKHISGADLVADKSVIAIKQLETQILQNMNLRGLQLPQMFNARQYCSLSSQYHNPSADARGLRVVRDANLTPFSSFYIKTLYLKSNKTGVHTIELRNAAQTALQTLSVTLVAGELYTADVNWDVSLTEFYIVFTNPDAKPAKGTCACGAANCCGTSFNYSHDNTRFFRVQGWDGTKASTDSHGIGIFGNIKCSLQNLVCAVLPYLKNAVLYQVGAAILGEALSGSRTNFLTVSNKEWMAEKRAEWSELAASEIEKVMPSLMGNLQKADTLCVTCEKLNQPFKVSMVNPMTQALRDLEAEYLGEIAELNDEAVERIADGIGLNDNPQIIYFF